MWASVGFRGDGKGERGSEVGLELDDDEGGGCANVGLVALNGLRQGLCG